MVEKSRECRDCGAPFTTRNNSTRCSPCTYKRKRAMAPPCPGCGGQKDGRAALCQKCDFGGDRRREVGRRAIELLHKPRATPQEVYERIRATVEPYGDGCRLATEGRDQNGYRRIHCDGADVLAHRLAYEVANGAIGEKMTIDHVCHNRAAAAGTCAGGPTCRHRACVNPEHLVERDAVSNWRGGTLGIPAQRRERMFCPHGHPYDDANTYFLPDNRGRACRTCMRIKGRERRRRERAKAREQKHE